MLSLFDGIGTAKVVLDKLNLDLEVYYSLEIEEDAIQVINLNHGDDVIHLGDVRSLTEEKVWFNSNKFTTNFYLIYIMYYFLFLL